MQIPHHTYFPVKNRLWTPNKQCQTSTHYSQMQFFIAVIIHFFWYWKIICKKMCCSMKHITCQSVMLSLQMFIIIGPDPQYSRNDSLIKKTVTITCYGQYSSPLRLPISISAVMILMKYHQLSPNSQTVKSIMYIYLIPNFT